MHKVKYFICLIAALIMTTLMAISSFAYDDVYVKGGLWPGAVGWYQVPDGSWRYYAEGTYLRDTTAEIGGKVYQFDANGTASDAIGTALPAQTAADPAFEGSSVHVNPYHHTCVEIDLTNQMLYAFDGETLVLQSPCVTGTKGSRDTSVGDWKVLSKETDRYLRGTNADGSKYKSWVSYWMPFHGGQGMHDSSWRGTSHANYGGNIYTYDGSHGCVNLPFDMAQALFNFVHVGTPVHVHN